MPKLTSNLTVFYKISTSFWPMYFDIAYLPAVVVLFCRGSCKFYCCLNSASAYWISTVLVGYKTSWRHVCHDVMTGIMSWHVVHIYDFVWCFCNSYCKVSLLPVNYRLLANSPISFHDILLFAFQMLCRK